MAIKRYPFHRVTMTVLWASSAFLVHAPLVLNAHEGNDMHIPSLSLDELKRLEVTTPGKVPETIRETPASVRVVDRKEIETLGYQTLTQALEGVPGFYNIDNYFGVSGNFGVRGYWNGRSQNSSVAMLINGIPQTRVDLWSHPMETMNVPVEAIDRIEIVRGPNAVIYGNGATFAAINIITNDSYFSDQASATLGDNGFRRAALRWSDYGEDWHVIFNGGFLSSDGRDPLVRELMGLASQAQLPALGISDPEFSLEGKLEQETGYLQLAGSWRNWYYDLSHNHADLEFYFFVPALEDGTDRETDVTRLTAGYRSDFLQRFAWDSRLSYNEFELVQDFEGFYVGFVGDNMLSYQSLEFESLLTYRWAEKNRLIVGANWQRLLNLYEFSFVPSFGLVNEVVEIDHRDTTSLYSQASLQLTDRLRFVGGARWEVVHPHNRIGYFNIEDTSQGTFGERRARSDNFTPRASLIYEFSEANVLKIMAGDAHRFNVLKDTSTSPESARTYEINFVRSAEEALFSLSIFKNSLKNLRIERLRILPGGIADSDSVIGGKVETEGIEALWRQHYGDHWTTEIALTLQESEDMQNPRSEASYSPEQIAHGRLIYSRGAFSAALSGRHVAAMNTFYVPAFDGSEGDFFIGQPVPSYTVFDLHVRWSGLLENGSLGLRVGNVLDEEIRYPNNPLNSALLDRGLLGEERSVSLTATIKF